jgi:hypothetical protein
MSRCRGTADECSGYNVYTRCDLESGHEGPHESTRILCNDVITRAKLTWEQSSSDIYHERKYRLSRKLYYIQRRASQHRRDQYRKLIGVLLPEEKDYYNKRYIEDDSLMNRVLEHNE